MAYVCPPRLWVEGNSRLVVRSGINAVRSSHHTAAVDVKSEELRSVKVGSSQQQIEELTERPTATAAKTGGQT